MVQLGANRYGKAEVRVMRVARGAGPGGIGDVIRDWNVSTSLSGDLAATHLTGDNSAVLATDTQKNTVYAFAQELGPVPPEVLAMTLAAHFVDSQPQITRARVAIEEYGWTPIGEPGHSFARTGELTRGCRVVHDDAAGVSVLAGVEDLTVLNTSHSEFWGFPRDKYTTLPETDDRMLATQVSAWWRYRGTGPRGTVAPGVDWDAAFGVARDALLSAFKETYSYSLQQTLYAIGRGIIAAVPEVCEVRLSLPNKHHYLVDLTPFGLPNANEVYCPGDRPYGLIEGTVLADDAPDPGPAWT
jgi:urate oxidase